MKITLFGKEYNFKIDPDPQKTCGLCQDGLITYIIRRDGYPYSFLARCTCVNGDGYGTWKYGKDGTRTFRKVNYPQKNPRTLDLLDHSRWPVMEVEDKVIF